MIGVVKIKDGLFICDEFGAQVSRLPLCSAGRVIIELIFEFES